MAWLFSGSLGLGRSTAPLPDYNSPYTILGKVFLGGLGATQALFVLTNAGVRDTCYVASNNTLHGFVDSGAGSTDITGTSVVASRWYDIALVRESVTSMKVYKDFVLDSTNTRDVTSRAAVAELEFGQITGGNFMSNLGRMSHIKIFTKALTVEELKREAGSIRPQSPVDLYDYYPTFSNNNDRLRGYENARDLSVQTGTLAMANDPPPNHGTMIHFGAPNTKPLNQYLNQRDVLQDENDFNVKSWVQNSIESWFDEDLFLSGTQAFNLVLDPGSYIITGLTSQFVIAIPATLGTYSLTGNLANFNIGFPATSGGYTYTGSIVAPTILIPLTAGSYILSGNSATPTLALNSSIGTYGITGSSATTVGTLFINAELGTYTITGSDASLVKKFVLIIDAGAYASTGALAGTLGILHINSESGAYQITGNLANMKIDVPLLLGNYSIQGFDVTFEGGAAILKPKTGGMLASQIVRRTMRRGRR